MDYRELLFLSGCVIAQIPILTYWSKKNNQHQDNRYIFPSVAIIAFGAWYECIFSHFLDVDTTIWFKAYTFMEFMTLCYFLAMVTHRKYRPFFWTMAGIFTVVFIGLQLHWVFGGKAKTEGWLAILETLLIYAGAVLWFRNVFTDMKLATLWDSPAFYYIAGFVLYFSGTLILFLMSDLVFTEKEMREYWIINVVLSIFLSLILILGIWKGQQKSL